MIRTFEDNEELIVAQGCLAGHVSREKKRF